MYQDFLTFLGKKKNILVLGKGHLNNKFNNNYDLYVGVKQSIAVLPIKDILIMNDFEGIFGIEEFVPQIKYILCPNAIHIKHQANNIYNQKLNKYLKDLGFRGKIINYEIYSNINPDKNLDFIETKNSGDIIFHFLNKINYKEKISIYGMFSCLDDNIKITKYILNRKRKEFFEEYNSFITRIYRNKRGINLLMLKDNLEKDLGSLKTNQDFKNLFIDSKNKLKRKYPKLNISFH